MIDVFMRVFGFLVPFLSDLIKVICVCFSDLRVEWVAILIFDWIDVG